MRGNFPQQRGILNFKLRTREWNFSIANWYQKLHTKRVCVFTFGLLFEDAPYSFLANVTPPLEDVFVEPNLKNCCEKYCLQLDSKFRCDLQAFQGFFR